MRWLFFVIFILSGGQAFAQVPQEDRRSYRPYTQDEAFSITTGAMLKNPSIGVLIKNSERWGWDQIKSIGLNEDYVRTGASIAAPFIYRKFSTRSFHMRWDPWKDITVRPDVDYYFDSRDYNCSLSLIWRFE